MIDALSNLYHLVCVGSGNNTVNPTGILKMTTSMQKLKTNKKEPVHPMKHSLGPPNRFFHVEKKV